MKSLGFLKCAALSFAVQALFAAACFGAQPEAPAPSYLFEFNENVDGKAGSATLKGRVVGRAAFIDASDSKAVVIKRWAYDQKASVSYSQIQLPRQGTISFQLKPMWEDASAPHEFLFLSKPGGELSFYKEQGDRIFLKLSSGQDSARVELPLSALKASFNDVAISWSSSEGRLSLRVGDLRKDASMSAASLERLFKDGEAFEMIIGAKSVSNYDGDSGDSAFAKLAICPKELSNAEIAELSSTRFARKELSGAEDESARALAKLRAEAASDYERKLWSLDDAETLSTATRREICLNGLWRFLPDNAQASKKRYYSKLSGTWLNKGARTGIMQVFKVFEEGGAKAVESIDGASTQDSLHAWYKRIVELPADFVGRSVYLKVKHCGSKNMKIFVNGQLVQAYALTGKFDQGLMQNLRADVSKFCEGGALDIVVESSFEGKEVAGRMVLMDISLERVDGSSFTEGARVETYVSKGLVEVKGRLLPSSKGGSLSRLSAVGEIFELDSGKLVAKAGGSLPEGARSFRLEIPARGLVCWSPENPKLYGFKVSLRDAKGALIDESHPLRIGYKELSMAESSFLLNGSKYRLYYSSSAVLDYGPRNTGISSQRSQARKTLKSYKDLGFNAVNVEFIFNKGAAWFNNESPIWQEAVLEACDELGLMVVLATPEYDELCSAEEYRAALERHIGFWGSHPSVAMYMDDFNKCMYIMQQHPAMANDYSYSDSKAPNSRGRQKANILKGDAIIHELDPSRIVYHNAGGNLTKLYTTMQYMSFGLPLQEREDWPCQWDKKHLYMTSEFGFPFEAQFYDFGCPSYFDNAKVLPVENAARFFGPSIYEKTETLYDDSTITKNNYMPRFRKDSSLLTPEYGQVKSLFAKANVRAWRGYDVSGFGIFQEEDALFFHPNYDWGRWFDNLTTTHPKAFGLSPELIRLDKRTPDHERPTDYFDVFKRALAPLVVYIVDKEPRWNSKDHAYYDDERVSKQALAINETLETKSLSLEISLSDGGKMEKLLSKTLVIPPGEQVRVPFSIPPRKIEGRASLSIAADLSLKGERVSSDEFSVELFHREAPAKPYGNTKWALYDPKGASASALSGAGVDFKRVSKFEELGDANVLVVGREALGSSPDALLSKVERAKLIEKGLSLLILEQKECSFANLIYQEERQRVVFKDDPSHPVLKGIEDGDLRDWRGLSDLCVDLDKPDIPVQERLWIYPTFKFACGSLGVVASNVMRKPVYGSFKSILSCGFDLANSPLAEMTRGEGRLVLCQLDVSSRYGKDPVASRLFDNILGYLASKSAAQASKEREWKGRKLRVLDGAGSLGPIDAFCSDSKRAGSLDEALSDGGVALVCGASDEELAAAKAKIAAFVEKGGVLVYVGLPASEGPLQWTPEPVASRQLMSFKAKPLGFLASRLTPADFYFRKEFQSAAFSSSSSGFEALSDNGAVASLRFGNGRILFAGYSLAAFKPVAIELGKSNYRTTKVPTYWGTIESDGLLSGTSYVSFIDKLVACKPVRIVNALLDQEGVFDSQPLFMNRLYMNGKKGGSSRGFEIGSWKFKVDMDESGLSKGWQSGDLNDGSWKPIELGVSWEKQGYTMANPKYLSSPDGKDERFSQYNGVAWYISSFELPGAFKEAGALRLQIESVDDYDSCFFNGRKIGSTGRETSSWWAVKRDYEIPNEAVNFGGRNVVAIRVVDVHADGAVNGPVVIAGSKKPAPEPAPYPADYPVIDLNAFHNW